MMLGDSLGNLCLSECLYYVVSTFVLLLLRGLVSSVLYYNLYVFFMVYNKFHTNRVCMFCMYEY